MMALADERHDGQSDVLRTARCTGARWQRNTDKRTVIALCLLARSVASLGRPAPIQQSGTGQDLSSAWPPTAFR